MMEIKARNKERMKKKTLDLWIVKMKKVMMPVKTRMMRMASLTMSIKSYRAVAIKERKGIVIYLNTIIEVEV
jgi:hypothetical protein